LAQSLGLKLVSRSVEKPKLLFKPATLEALALMLSLNAQPAESRMPQYLPLFQLQVQPPQVKQRRVASLPRLLGSLSDDDEWILIYHVHKTWLNLVF